MWLLRFDPAVEGATVTEQGGTPSLARCAFVVIILLIMLLTDVSFHVVRVHHQGNDDGAAGGNIWGKGSLPRCAFITILLVP